jgi:hypothetical protein
MRRFGWVALCAAGVMALAGQASARVMEAVAAGDFNDLEPAYVGWNATLTYDTSRGVQTPTSTGETLHWDLSQSAPSPLIELAGQVDGTSGFAFDLTSATSFDITRDLDIYYFQIIGGSYSIAFGYPFFSPLHDPAGTDVSLDANYSTAFPLGDFAVHGDICGCGVTGYTSVLSVQRVAGGVPEPATWAAMLAGFFAVGSVLRRHRHVGVIA